MVFNVTNKMLNKLLSSMSKPGVENIKHLVRSNCS